MSLRTIAIAMCASSLAGCFGESCGNTVVNTIQSPSGNTKAVVFSRQCSAPTGTSTQISVLTASAALANGAGNALVLDGAIPLGVKWTSADALEVSGIGTASVLREEHSVGGVRLSFTR